MHILIAADVKLPVSAYGGVGRVAWWLGKALSGMGHRVTFLVAKGSICPFAEILYWDKNKPIGAQIPLGVEIAHFHFDPKTDDIPVPWLMTMHDNAPKSEVLHPNTVFLSSDHAQRHGGQVFVYNGIDLSDYGDPETSNPRRYFHFLGQATMKVQNLKGAIEIAKKVNQRLHVIGGSRMSFAAGLRITLSPLIRFHGILNNEGRNVILEQSKGFIFPVLWSEPFGLAVIESLYFGCPVFGTPYGSLPELLGRKPHPLSPKRAWTGEVDAFQSAYGFLSVKKSEIIEAVRAADTYDRAACKAYVIRHFTSERMAKDYLALYEQVKAGRNLHDIAPGAVRDAVEFTFV
ncbi:MAG: glycosyltransferase [Saprospiraceae bacterium]